LWVIISYGQLSEDEPPFLKKVRGYGRASEVHKIAKGIVKVLRETLFKIGKKNKLSPNNADNILLQN